MNCQKQQLPERITILQDVGSDMNQLAGENGALITISKRYTMQHLLNKIFSKSTDEFALITFGDKRTNNKLSEGSQYQAINVQTQHFSVVNRDILSLVENLEVNEDEKGDWLDGIVVALQFIQDEFQHRACARYKIVLFSNLNSPVCDNQVDVITKQIKDMGIHLTVIGPGKEDKSPGDGVAAIVSILEKVEGAIFSFKEASPEWMYLQRTTTKPTPWNSMFTISSTIKIPIRGFKKIAKVKPYKWIFGTLDDENGVVENKKAYVRYDEVNKVEIQVEEEHLIDAYKFGTSSIVPVSDGDKEGMMYRSGPKGLYLVGCTVRDAVPQYLLMGNGSYIILAKEDDDVANTILQSFIEAMVRDNLVGITRKVHIDNSTACLGVLYPQVTNEKRYFVYAELPFAEDEHIFKFSSFPKIQAVDEKRRVVDSFVDSMDLDVIDSEGDRYDFTRIHDPHEQHVLRCLGHRYIHPNDTIPHEIIQDMVQVIQPSEEVVNKCKYALRKVVPKFPLEVVVEKTKLNKFHNCAAIMEEVSEDTPLKLEPVTESGVALQSSKSEAVEAGVKCEDVGDSWLDDL